MFMTHFNSIEWDKSSNTMTQEELQEMAAKIREHCKVTEIVRNGKTSACTVLENKALGLKYWIHDDLGNITEITEGRSY